jgi:hypothetical protein
MKTYIIYNLTTKEVLSDNLTFDEVPELYKAYDDFYPDCEIIACYYEAVNNSRKIISNRKAAYNAFISEWICLMDELTKIGNLY